MYVQLPSYLQVPPVDLIDDLQVTRQQVLEEVDGPALQGFRQDGVVGVGTGTNHNVPGLDTERTGSQTGGLEISDIITHIHMYLRLTTNASETVTMK